MADLQIVDIGTTKTDSTIDADGDYLAADTTAGATYKALVDDFIIAALAQTASTVAIAADVNVDSGTLFVDVSANSVGIGTTSPEYQLHQYLASGNIRHRIQTSDDYIDFGIIASGPRGFVSSIMNSAYGRLDIDAAPLVINSGSSGSVGIGTTSPAAKLQVNGSFAIVDGMTAPSTISGYAVIYVDSADGDLKVKFGNGFIATIASDS